MLGFFKSLKECRRVAASLYGAALVQARQPLFYTGRGLEDTVDSRFELIVLHTFLVWNRIRGEGQDGARLAQAVFDTMFVDMERALRLIGIGDLSIPRHMRRMMRGFKGRALAYKDGLENPDDPDVLLQALRRNLFGTVETVDEDHLRWFAAYIQAGARLLAQQSGDDLVRGQISFEGLINEQENNDKSAPDARMVA
jgi:cytochrome b pre-mRNA-processing protein 3